MKKIFTLCLLAFAFVLKAQVNVDFNTASVPSNWIVNDSFEITDGVIYPNCQTNALVGSLFTENETYLIQTATYTYTGGPVQVQLNYGIKDLYNALGVYTYFHKPQISFEYSEGSSGTWISHEILNLDDVVASTNCLNYTTTIPASSLVGFEAIKYRFKYVSPAKQADPFLLYWSIDSITISEVNNTPCDTSAPTGEVNQTVTEDTTLADLDVTGVNIIWYSDADLTEVLSADTIITDGETYYATQTINGCESEESLAVTVQVEFLSAVDFSKISLVVYPNPVEDVLLITSDQTIQKIEIFNTLGQQILSATTNATEYNLSVSTLNKGIYFLKINSNKTIKFIKK